MAHAIALSAGHSAIVRGAEGFIDEVDEARRVCVQLAKDLERRGVAVYGPFFDDVSDDQSENLNRIVDWHNDQPDHEYDVSVHFNASDAHETSEPIGTECLYVSQERLADQIAEAIHAASGLKNRGAKYRSDLKFLNSTDAKSVLLEICFVNSSADVTLYQKHFHKICSAIAEVFADQGEEMA